MSTVPKSSCRLPSGQPRYLLAFSDPHLRAQDAVRPSLAGEATAEARRQSIKEIQPIFWPVRFRFSITTGLSTQHQPGQVNKQDDAIIRPQFNIDAIGP
jgi:hypothetical protein